MQDRIRGPKHMAIGVKNIFADLSSRTDEEEFLTLLETAKVKIERIVSHSHVTPEGSWYDQAADEWVMVLRGEATLEFEGDELVQLKEGDYVLVPRRTKHRVSQTGATTVWLAIHVQ